MAENQSTHRQKQEDKVITSQLKQSERGQMFAMILAVLLIVVGVWAFVTDHDAVSSTIFGVTVVGLVAVFITGKRSQKKELSSKA